MKPFSGSSSGYFHLFSLFFGDRYNLEILYYHSFYLLFVGVWIRRKEEPSFLIFFLLWMLPSDHLARLAGTALYLPASAHLHIFHVSGNEDPLSANSLRNYHQSGQWDILWFLAFNHWYLPVQFEHQTRTPICKMTDPSTGHLTLYSMEVYHYIKEKTPSDSVIIFFKPRAMRLMTDHDTLMSTECERMSHGRLYCFEQESREKTSKSLPKRSMPATCHWMKFSKTAGSSSTRF